MIRKPTAGGLVYSTESGRMCPACRKPVADCICNTRASKVGQGDGVVRVSRETKSRGGKAVTVIRGVPLDATALATLGKQLRAACGAGGTLKGGVLEVQGDHCDRVMDLLKAQGWLAIRAGG